MRPEYKGITFFELCDALLEGRERGKYRLMVGPDLKTYWEELKGGVYSPLVGPLEL